MKYNKNIVLNFVVRKVIKPIYLRLTRVRGINNKIIKESFIENLDIKVGGNDNLVYFKPNSSLYDIKIFIKGNNNRITVCENCTIKSGIFWIEDNNCKIFIGRDTTVESFNLGVSEDNSEIVIGQDCMFSSNIRIMTGDSHSIVDIVTNQRINPPKSILIGDHVWIGSDVRIMKGVKILDNSVVGLGSIVNKSFEQSHVIISGIPAKIVRENINWDRKRI